MIQLRRWQAKALSAYKHALAADVRALLWEATPGSGKTTAALQVVLHQLEATSVKQVVVVVPTTHLKVQWAHAAAQLNIDLDSSYKSQYALSRDFDGVVATYQQIANNPAPFRKLARNGIVVLDEIHHAGEGLQWGDKLRQAFDDAPFVLCLSGTPFRSDNSAIPFVSYSKDGESQPDIVYSYSEAIGDGVCRPIAFFTYGGEVAWHEGGQTVEVGFADDLFGSLAARRLRVALEPESGWVEPMVAEAHQMLQETRRDHPEAGGLLVAADQAHAREMGELLYKISGTLPTVVLSDDREASNKIKAFGASNKPWIVACNMVSEGVDIPRLRVGVYATTITTRMYFRQFLGRMVRITPQPNGVQVAYIYLPADPRLRRLAEEIETEQKHIIRHRPEDDRWQGRTVSREGLNGDDPGWSALYSTNSGLDAVIVSGQQLALFDGMAPQEPVQPAVVRKKIKQKVEERVIPKTKREQKQDLVKAIRELAGRLHHDKKVPYSEIHSRLNKRQGVQSQAVCTVEQLEQRITLLKQMLR
ncbi:MAG: DEAD/DEAH box helicase family protein [Chloroflexota bacterium]